MLQRIRHLRKKLKQLKIKLKNLFGLVYNNLAVYDIGLPVCTILEHKTFAQIHLVVFKKIQKPHTKITSPSRRLGYSNNQLKSC